ncbi:thioredoxin-like protein, partial [Pelagophyceae sp. CCMP2097]
DAVQHPTSLAELTSLVNDPAKLVIVDFGATWCGPCQRIAPLYASLAAEMPGVVFVKVDVDEIEDAAAAFDVQALPTFVLFRDGEEVARFSGASEETLRQTL